MSDRVAESNEKFEQAVKYLEARRRSIKASLEAMLAKFTKEAEQGPWNLANHMKWKTDDFIALGADERVLEFHLGNAVAHFQKAHPDDAVARWSGLCLWFKRDFQKECLNRLLMVLHQSTNPIDNLKEQLEDKAYGEAYSQWSTELFWGQDHAVDEALRGEKLKLTIDKARDLGNAISEMNGLGGFKSRANAQTGMLQKASDLRRMLDRFYPEQKPALTATEQAEEAARRG